MEINDALVAITDIVLGAEFFFLSGMLFSLKKSRYSPAFYWQIFIFFIGIGWLLGGIDHGFLEHTYGKTDAFRVIFMRVSWFFVCIALLFIWLTIAKQFLRGWGRRIVYVAALSQFIILIVYLLFYATPFNFKFLMLNQLICFLGLLVFNVIKKDRVHIISAGIVLIIISSGVQIAKIKLGTYVDHNVLFHIGMMIVAVLFYLGGKKLKTTCE